MPHFDTAAFDDAATTQRFFRVDPDATSAYDITPIPVLLLDRAVAHQLRAHEERRLAALEAA